MMQRQSAHCLHLSHLSPAPLRTHAQLSVHCGARNVPSHNYIKLGRAAHTHIHTRRTSRLTQMDAVSGSAPQAVMLRCYR